MTPDGRLSYSQSGTYRWNDPTTGQSYEIPQWTATQELSPQQQAIKNQSDAAELNLATLGQQQSGRLQGLLSQPVSLDNATTEARLMELGRQRLDPVLREREDASRTRLANMGLGMGSEAYNREMRRVSEAENDAYNQLLLQGRGQAVQERLTERNQPINEITALLSGSQVSQPNFVNTPGMNMPTTDYAGIMQQNYANRANAAGQRSQAMGGLFGGLLGAGANLGSAWLLR